jgi:hypothetical protein
MFSFSSNRWSKYSSAFFDVCCVIFLSLPVNSICRMGYIKFVVFLIYWKEKREGF